MLRDCELSYCDCLQAQGRGYDVGDSAQVFISHAWKYTFTQLVNALEGHSQDRPDIVICFDLFSNNQVIAPDQDFNWWSTTFKSECY